MNKIKPERYLVAWSGDNQCFYGKDKEKDKIFGWVDALTFNQAKRQLKRFPKSHGKQKVKIFKLVEVEML